MQIWLTSWAQNECFSFLKVSEFWRNVNWIRIFLSFKAQSRSLSVLSSIFSLDELNVVCSIELNSRRSWVYDHFSIIYVALKYGNLCQLALRRTIYAVVVVKSKRWWTFWTASSLVVVNGLVRLFWSVALIMRKFFEALKHGLFLSKVHSRPFLNIQNLLGWDRLMICFSKPIGV